MKDSKEYGSVLPYNPNSDSDGMTEAETPVWREQLKRAIRENRRDAHNRYLQFATLGLDGKPRVRMVVVGPRRPRRAPPRGRRRDAP